MRMLRALLRVNRFLADTQYIATQHILMQPQSKIIDMMNTQIPFNKEVYPAMIS